MTQVNVTPAINPSLGVNIEALRIGVGEATTRAYGAERAYAEGLCEVLPAEWYLVEHSDMSDAAKPVHAEKKALYTVLKAAKHTNPSTVWARVRKYAQEFVEGVPEKGEGEGEKESVGKRETRSIRVRFLDDLVGLYKAGKREESLPDDIREAHVFVTSALKALGVDVSTLVK